MVKLLAQKKPEGVTKEMMALTLKFLKENRKYFGRAAISLTNQLNDPKYEKYNINSKIVGAGIEGEQKTSKILREWIHDKDDCVLIDSISLPINNLEPEVDGEDGQLDLGDTDHLLIIGNSIVIIDSKNWKEKASYKFDEDGSILRTKKQFKGNRPRARECQYLWEKYYENMKYDKIYSYVCISSDKPIIIRDRNWWKQGYKLVNQETLIYFLDKLYEEDIEETGFIRVDLVAKALMGLNTPYNKFKEKFGAVYDIAREGY